MTDELWSDSTGLLLVKFVFWLVKEHHVQVLLTTRNTLVTFVFMSSCLYKLSNVCS